ncbi:MAG TPA: YciI family protein [Nocardioides sp.]|uniref:YciI family protein n=1 Tax=Nocardioides sp. TaxID=35761 RepID=UPI002F4070A4
MKYMLIHAVDESRLDDLPPQVETELEAWAEEMVGRGIELDGARLHPTSEATTVRAVGGEVQVTDGPFAETKEQIAGYDVIDCPDLDTAIAVASAHPTLHVGAIEVRAFDEGMSDPEVPRLPADGRRRYLMLVCADMRRAMAEDAAAGAVQAASPDLWDPPDPEQPDGPDEPDEPDDITRWIADAGPRRVYGWPLQLPNRAVTVRRVDGSVVTTDGPFAETKEQVGGFDLLECRDLDDAIAVAAGHPVADGGVLELRPLWS